MTCSAGGYLQQVGPWKLYPIIDKHDHVSSGTPITGSGEALSITMNTAGFVACSDQWNMPELMLLLILELRSFSISEAVMTPCCKEDILAF